ncbi:MAG: DUF2156 domain-containing protein [Elusimicrobia bacterium]|nr:DUF2156 domain-containing protein [Elusimicrobiota bacterium]
MTSFSPFKVSDYPRLKPWFAGGNHPHSEYALSSLILWDRCILAADYAVDGDTLLVSETYLEEPQDRFLLLPLPARAACPPELLKKKAVEAGFSEYRFVHEGYLAAHGLSEVERHFKVSEQPGYNDYVYRVEDLAGLEGRELAKKRNHVRRFEKECALNGWKLETVRLSDSNAQACVDCLERWRVERAGKDWTEVLECEREAITAALKDFDRLELRGGMVLVQGVVVGFGIAAVLNEDTGVLLFEKASERYKGLYQYLDRECARLLFGGLRFVNKEGDQQDPGLAKAKESYHPSQRVKAYRLEVR